MAPSKAQRASSCSDGRPPSWSHFSRSSTFSGTTGWLPKATGRSNIKDCLHRAGILGVRTGAAEVHGGLFLRLSQASLILFVFSLGAMQPSIHVLGFDAVPSDAIYLILAASTGLAITTGQLRPRWHRFFGALAIYFGALVLSAFFSRDPGQSADQNSDPVLSAELTHHHLLASFE